MKNYTLDILNELTQNAKKIDLAEIEHFVHQIKAANHIFLNGAGRSGIAIQAFANRLMHLGFSVSLVGEISSPHSKPGDLLIICSGSGETGSLKSLAEKAKRNADDFAQPMGSAFEQLAFLMFDGMVLNLMEETGETSEKMFGRHADFE